MFSNRDCWYIDLACYFPTQIGRNLLEITGVRLYTNNPLLEKAGLPVYTNTACWKKDTCPFIPTILLYKLL